MWIGGSGLSNSRQSKTEGMVDELIRECVGKAEVLVEAWPYIKVFAGKIIVVKAGGSFMDRSPDLKGGVLTDLAFMQAVNMLPVLVHGGGPAISERLKEKEIKSEFVNGLRVTTPEVMKEVRSVMNQKINPDYTGTLQNLGARAAGVFGETVVKAAKKEVIDQKTGKPVDLGQVGVPVGVDPTRIRMMLLEKVIPVITPLGRGEDGQTYNVNADESAAAIAVALGARKLVYLSDKPGVLEDPDDPGSLFSELSIDEANRLIRKGTIKGGMLPKVESAIDTLQKGVRNVHFIDGRIPHALLLELFTDRGIGTIFML